MNRRDMIEFLAILDKLKIHTNPNLTDEQKEICKYCIDQLKKKVQ